jgi:hypothetical protein
MYPEPHVITRNSAQPTVCINFEKSQRQFILQCKQASTDASITRLTVTYPYKVGRAVA